MGRISDNTRETIIQLHQKGHKPRDICKLIPGNVDPSLIYRLIEKYEKTGSVKDRRKTKHSKFSVEMGMLIHEIYSEDRYGFVFPLK